MRIVGILIAAVVVFVAALLVPLALTGKLNADTFKRLAGLEAKPAATKTTEEAATAEMPSGPLATKVKEEQERLRKWEADLQKRAEELDKREQSVNEMLTDVTKKAEEVQAIYDKLDAEHQASLQLAAKTLEKMDPAEAAKDFNKMDPEDGARIAALISDRIRGAIFDAMDESKRVDLLKAIQAKKL